jgi:cytochrome P450
MAQAIHIEDLSDPSFDPFVADDVLFGDADDPYRVLAALRARGPVIEGSLRTLIGMPGKAAQGYDGEYTVLSYAGVEQILNDPGTFSNEPMRHALANFGPLLTVMDPPDHTRYRRILQRTFRPLIVHDWVEHVVGPVVDEQIASIEHRGAAELVDEFARPYPFHVIYRLLALPAEDIEIFYRLTVAQIGSPFAAEASAKLGRYFAGLLDARRTNPGNDLISVVASLLDDEDALPEDVAISFLLQLMSAGGETTFRTTSVLLFGLLTDPDQLDAVRRDHELIPQAVEEALRWDGPVIRGTRSTTCDTVVDGVPIPANSVVHAAYGAANRDPAVFAEPDRFDVLRERHRHFGFAFGAHNCLGQQLARLEMACALDVFLDRLPNVRLDPASPPPRLRGANMRTPRQLHVVYGR